MDDDPHLQDVEDGQMLTEEEVAALSQAFIDFFRFRGAKEIVRDEATNSVFADGRKLSQAEEMTALQDAFAFVSQNRKAC